MAKRTQNLKDTSPSALDNRANQLNPQHPVYDSSRAATPPRPAPPTTQADLTNRANQLNPSHIAYYQSRGQEVPAHLRKR